MTKLLTLMILLTACGSVEDGAVSVEVNAPSTPSEESQNLPSPTPEVGKEVAVISDTNEENQPEVGNDPSPTSTPITINVELIGQKKDVFDTLFQTRIDNLLTWDIGQDWTAKQDRLDYTFTALKDYLPADLGSLTSPEENRTWIKDVFSSNGHGPQYICGEVEWTDVTFSYLTIVWADNTVSHIRIEMAFYEDMTIKYISLDLQKSTDADEQGWVNQTCN